MAGRSQSSEIYRATPIGVALTRSLNTMIVSKQITSDAAIKIMAAYDMSTEMLGLTRDTTVNNIHLAHMIDFLDDVCNENFDQVIPATIKEYVAKRTIDDVSAEGEMVQYNNLHELWKIDAENVKIKVGSKVFNCKRVRFIFE